MLVVNQLREVPLVQRPALAEGIQQEAERMGIQLVDSRQLLQRFILTEVQGHSSNIALDTTPPFFLRRHKSWRVASNDSQLTTRVRGGGRLLAVYFFGQVDTTRRQWIGKSIRRHRVHFFPTIWQPVCKDSLLWRLPAAFTLNFTKYKEVKMDNSIRYPVLLTVAERDTLHGTYNRTYFQGGFPRDLTRVLIFKVLL